MPKDLYEGLLSNEMTNVILDETSTSEEIIIYSLRAFWSWLPKCSKVSNVYFWRMLYQIKFNSGRNNNIRFTKLLEKHNNNMYWETISLNLIVLGDFTQHSRNRWYGFFRKCLQWYRAQNIDEYV